MEESLDTLHAWFELLVKLVASCPPRQNMLHIWGEEFPITAPKSSAFLRSHGWSPIASVLPGKAVPSERESLHREYDLAFLMQRGLVIRRRRMEGALLG